MKRLPLFSAALVSAALLASACGTVSPYAARVDGERISQKDLEREMRAVASNAQYVRLVLRDPPVKGAGEATFDATFTALTLTIQIYFELVERELSRRKLTVTRADLDAARPAVIRRVQGEEIFRDFPRSYQEKLVRQSAQLNVLTLALAGVESLDEAARAVYDANRDRFAKARVSHILVATREQADAARARIAAGQDFAAVAKEVSTDASSRERNGDLGVEVTRNSSLAAPFLEAVFSIPVNDVSQPVQTSFGFHLIKVTSREVPPFEQVADDARQQVLLAHEEKFSNWLVDALRKAKIEVNPKYGTFDPTGNNPGVVPPRAPSASTTVPSGANLVPNQP